jgi:hypothetical protein
MRDVLLIILASLAVGCMSSTRTREVHCLGSLMLEVWTSQEKLDSLEADRRAVLQARSSSAPRSLPLSYLDDTRDATPVSLPEFPVEARANAEADSRRAEEELDRQLVDQRVRVRRSVDWYRRVSRRVQTRLEEDEILYSTLGALAISPVSLVFYPIVRWNVRSVLWEEGDPDALDDPVRRFCTRWLEGSDPSSAPLVP